MTEVNQIGRYQVVAHICSGAMGDVYKAYDPEIDQYLAIKTISKTFLGQTNTASHAEFEQRFKNEVIAGRRLKHPNIVGIYD